MNWNWKLLLALAAMMIGALILNWLMTQAGVPVLLRVAVCFGAGWLTSDRLRAWADR